MELIDKKFYLVKTGEKEFITATEDAAVDILVENEFDEEKVSIVIVNIEESGWVASELSFKKIVKKLIERRQHR